jgi:hypothetical protein
MYSVTIVNRVWFGVACFGHQNSVDAIVILLVSIRLDVADRSRSGVEKKAGTKTVVGKSYTELCTRNQGEIVDETIPVA